MVNENLKPCTVIKKLSLKDLAGSPGIISVSDVMSGKILQFSDSEDYG